MVDRLDKLYFKYKKYMCKVLGEELNETWYRGPFFQKKYNFSRAFIV